MNHFLLLPSILMLLELVSSAAGRLSGQFDSSIPLSARGIKDERLTIPCGVTLLGNDEKVQWRDVKQDKMVTDNGRVRVEEENGNVWNLVFEPLQKLDRGFYECIITNDQEMESLYYELAVLEPSDDIKWSTSLSCRNRYHKNEGDACDARGTYPCCNYYYIGQCGYSPLHCDCAKCIDYRYNNTEPYFLYPELTTVRTKVGARAQIPCYIKNMKSPIKFERLIGDEYKVLIDRNNLNLDKDPRHVFVVFNDIGALYLEIEPVQKSDEGKYRCRFVQNGNTYQKEYGLKVLDATEKTRWRTDNICGGGHELYSSNGVSRFLERPCDEMGVNPCCKSNGFCGATVEYCKCDGCIDYRKYDQLWKSCEKSGGSFPCNPGNCINSYLQCDGKYDCDNGVDEHKCEVKGIFAEIDDTELNDPLGENFTLSCKVMNLGKFETVNWRRADGDLPLPNDGVDGISVSNSSNVWKLHFASTDSTNEGRYSCEIRTETGVRRQMYDCKAEAGNFTCDITGSGIVAENEDPTIAGACSIFASYLMCLLVIFMVHLVS